MLIFPPAMEIGEHEGFTREKDIFSREPLGIGLTNVVRLINQPTVFAINAQWGAGKTTFLKMWAGHLRSAGYPVIYFDAFASDFSEDAFTALAAEIIELLNKNTNITAKRKKVFIERAVGAGKVLARSALKLGVKAATLGALDGSEIDGLAEAASAESEGLIDKYVGEMLTHHGERKGKIEAFRSALRELPSALAKADGHEHSKPLVFIIDELDRCRPHFSLAILERIKHFFSVDNIHFVLGVHLDQLENCVSAAYGPGIDAAVYLQKFMQFIIPLPDIVETRQSGVNIVYLDYLINAMDFPKTDSVEQSMTFIRHYSAYRPFSLRDAERVMTNLALSLAFLGDRTIRPGIILAGLAIMRTANPAMYARVKNGLVEYPEVEALFGFSNNPKSGYQGYSDWELGWWKYCLLDDPGQGILNTFSHAIPGYMFGDRKKFLPTVANQVVDRFILD